MSSPRSPIALGFVCILVAVIGLFVNVRGFDRSHRATDVPAGNPDAWTPDARGANVTLALGRYALPWRGIVRAVICPRDEKDPHAKFRVSDEHGRVLEEETFTSDESRGGRCYEASYRSRDALVVVPSISVPAGSITVCHAENIKGAPPECRFAKQAVFLSEVEVRASKQITPPSMWPVLALLLGFGLIVLAPHRRRAAGAPIEGFDSPPTPEPEPEVEPVANASAAPVPPPYAGGLVHPSLVRPGVVPAGFGTGEDAASADAVNREAWGRSVSKPTFTGPPVDWPFSPLLALVGYVVVHVIVSAFAVAAFVRFGRGVLETGTFIAATMLVQHAALIAMAVLMLGMHSGRDLRVALGFLPVRQWEVVRALLIAGGLLGIAVVTTHFIKDVSATPMGQAIERMPVRYAIGFGALLAPFSEELFFRGVLVRAFGKRRLWVGVVVSAVVFTAAHGMQLTGALVGLVPIASVGLANGYLRAKSGGITQSWIVHCAYNGALSVGLYFS